MLVTAITDSAERGVRLDSRLHDVAWGLLLALTGGVWLIPEESVPQGAWLFGVAAILLGFNVVRYLSQITVNGLSLVLGLMALIAALSRLWRTDLPLFPICLVIHRGQPGGEAAIYKNNLSMVRQ
jgi:hypothetical protein